MQPQFYEFGEFKFDVVEKCLRSGAGDISLGPKAFPVLLYLITSRDRVITYDELLAGVWGDEAVDQNLVEQTIKRIRSKLGDDVENPRYIRTVDTLGYQFVAAVKAVDGSLEPHSIPSIVPSPHEVIEVPADSSSAPAKAPVVPVQMTRGKLGALGIAITILIGYFLRPVEAPLEVQHSIGLTQSNKLKLAPILTDGSKLYYQEQLSTGYRIVQMANQGGETAPLRIPVPNAELCDLSPDGKELIIRSLVRPRIEPNPVFIESLEEGEPHRVGNILAFEANWFEPNHSIIYSVGSDVYTTDREGLHSSRLLQVPGKAYWFRRSPDGRKLRFSIMDSSTDSSFLWEADLKSGALHRLLPDWKQQQCCGSWSGDGRHYFFQAVVDGSYQIFAKSEETHIFLRSPLQPEQLTFAPISHRGPTPSRDGKVIYVRAVLPRGEIMRYDTAQHEFLPLISDIYAYFASYSRDGQSLAYVSLPDGVLYKSALDGRPIRALTDKPLQVALPRWSPEGDQVAFMGRYPNSIWKIYTVFDTGGTPRPLQPSDSENEADPDWSPDGKTMVFGRMPSHLQSSPEKVLIHLVSLEDRHEWTLTGSQGYFSPRWSPKNGQIAAVAADGTEIVLFDAASGDRSTLARAGTAALNWSRGAGYLNWSNDGEYLFFLAVGNSGRAIFRVRLHDHETKEVLRLDGIAQPSFLFGDWFGLGSNNVPLVVRNHSMEDIYALELQVR